MRTAGVTVTHQVHLFIVFKIITVIDGKKTQSKASLWRMKRGYQEQEEDGHEGGMHHHQLRGELEHVLSLDIGDGSVKK